MKINKHPANTGSESGDKNVVSTTSSEHMEAQPATDSGEQQSNDKPSIIIRYN